MFYFPFSHKNQNLLLACNTAPHFTPRVQRLHAVICISFLFYSHSLGRRPLEISPWLCLKLHNSNGSMLLNKVRAGGSNPKWPPWSEFVGMAFSACINKSRANQDKNPDWQCAPKKGAWIKVKRKSEREGKHLLFSWIESMVCQLLFLGALCVCLCGCHMHTMSFTQLLPGKSHVQVVEMILESVKKASERVSAKVNKSKWGELDFVMLIMSPLKV